MPGGAILLQLSDGSSLAAILALIPPPLALPLSNVVGMLLGPFDGPLSALGEGEIGEEEEEEREDDERLQGCDILLGIF